MLVQKVAYFVICFNAVQSGLSVRLLTSSVYDTTALSSLGNGKTVFTMMTFYYNHAVI